jgi:hypothetical protein
VPQPQACSHALTAASHASTACSAASSTSFMSCTARLHHYITLHYKHPRGNDTGPNTRELRSRRKESLGGGVTLGALNSYSAFDMEGSPSICRAPCDLRLRLKTRESRP